MRYEYNKSRLPWQKTDIKLIPFEEIGKGTELDILNFISKHQIEESWDWLATQLLAHLAQYSVPSSKDGYEFLAYNIGKDPREAGIYKLTACVSRGKLMKVQTSKEHLPVCALVPLYMAAQKQYNNVPYTGWTNIEHLVGKDLYEAMTYELPQLTSDEILAVREAGLRYYSKSGTMKHRNPQTYHTLNNIRNTEIGKMPRLAKVMVTQIWCAHPANRHQYMVLDPNNWDNMPEPLIKDPLLDDTMPWLLDEKPKASLPDLPWLK